MCHCIAAIAPHHQDTSTSASITCIFFFLNRTFLLTEFSPYMANRASEESLANGYRTRFIYCSIGAVLLCFGVIILVSGIVVYILAHSGSGTHINDFFYHHQAEKTLNHTPILIAIILSSFGVTLIAISIVFSFLACLTNGHIGETQFGQCKYREPEREQEGQQVTSPLLLEGRVAPVVSSTTPKYFCNHQPVAPTQFDTPTPSPTKQGDINTVGLPPPATTRRVPPNGFSYLVNPSEIHSYHHNRQGQSAGIIGPVRVQHLKNTTGVIPTASNKESEI